MYAMVASWFAYLIFSLYDISSSFPSWIIGLSDDHTVSLLFIYIYMFIAWIFSVVRCLQRTLLVLSLMYTSLCTGACHVTYPTT